MDSPLTIISFNLHGFTQGSSTVRDLIMLYAPDVILIQEHWLTPANLQNLESFDGYFSYGSSAMAHVIWAGVLRGRPIGGVAALIKDSLILFTVTIVREDRFCVIKIGDLLLWNLYLPCVGTPDRSIICNSTLLNISSYRGFYRDCECLITGDFNVNLAVCSDISMLHLCDSELLDLDMSLTIKSRSACALAHFSTLLAPT